jgi:hypothetical protein
VDVQQGLREDAPELRERPRAAVHASRPNPITWAVVRRTLIAATVVSLIISAMFLFQGGGVRAIAVRSLTYLIFGWAGSILGLLCARLVGRTGIFARGMWPGALLTGLIMAPPMGLVVLAVVSVANGHLPPRRELPDILWETVVVCVAMSFLSVLVSRRAAETAPAPAGPPKFLDRIPLKLRGGELWAVEAEDHYLRLHTSKGQDLILMRLADAIDELAGVEGAQVHRSWWVARDAIADARRGDGRAVLTLKDGSEVPVSRTYARHLRERRWI